MRHADSVPGCLARTASIMLVALPYCVAQPGSSAPAGNSGWASGAEGTVAYATGAVIGVVVVGMVIAMVIVCNVRMRHDREGHLTGPAGVPTAAVAAQDVEAPDSPRKSSPAQPTVLVVQPNGYDVACGYEVGKGSQGQRISEDLLESQRSSVETVRKLEQESQLCVPVGGKPAWEGDQPSITAVDSGSAKGLCQPN